MAGATPGGRGGPVIALTGATGFLGGHIARELLEAGYTVRASVRATSDRSGLTGLPVQFAVVDLLDPVACCDFVRGARAVIHCAGLVSAPDEAAYMRANVETTRALLSACRREWHPQGGGTFLLISSLAAHGPAGPESPAREGDPCRPVTAYGRSKVAAEKLVLEHEHPFGTRVLRPPALYGPGDRAFLPLIKLALRGWMVRFAGPMRGLSLVHGKDAARAAIALLESKEAAGIYFVDDGARGYDWADMARALTLACGRRVRLFTIPVKMLKVTASVLRPVVGNVSVLRRDRIGDLEVPGWVCDGGHLEQDTGFAAAYDLTAGFADTLAFYRREGWL